MNDQQAGPVVVAVEELGHVQQLVRTAGDLAAQHTGEVLLVTVAVKRSNSPISVLSDETIVRQFAESSHELLAQAETPEGVTVERDVLVARSAASGLIDLVEDVDPVALVVGWDDDPSRSDAVFGTTADTLVERAPCDLYVERVGREADRVDRVLLPVAGGPHVETAAEVAAAIALRNDAAVTVFSVDASPEYDPEAFVEEGVDALQAAGGEDIPIETRTRKSEDITATLIDASQDHDVVVLGTTRKSSLRRRIAGSVPRDFVDRTDKTVIIGRNVGVVGGPQRWLGGLFDR